MRYVLIFAFVALTVYTGVVIFSKKQSPVISEIPAEKKEIKKPGGTPVELFFYDRNYPDYIVDRKIFQERLAALQRHDESTPRSRGLEYPWTLQGPGNIGGRVNAVAVHPTDVNQILLGYAQGGIYRTENNGQTWTPVFDEHRSLSIGHISYDVNHPDTVYASTGDVNISGYPFVGNGVYRSVDAGKTWQYVGLGDQGVLSKIFCDINNSNILYAGSMGFPSHKGDEKGFWRSTNFGQSWTKTLTIDDSTGIIDIAPDPANAGRLYATGYARLRTTKYSNTKCPGTSIYRSDDFGQSWMQLENGLPDEPHSRTSVEVTNNGTVFVSYIGDVLDGECAPGIETVKYIFRSIDGGFSWQQVNSDPVFGVPCEIVGNFGWYFEAIKVNPDNPQDIFLLGVDLYRTIDGGNSWFEAAPTWWFDVVHADKHDIAFAHGNVYLGTDGGAYMQPVNASLPWSDIENIPSTQFYRTTFNPHQPDQYFGGAQDNGTTGGNNNAFNEWPRIFGGDGFQPLFDPEEPRWMYALTQYGNVWFSDDSLNGFKWLGQGLTGERYWDMPLVMSPYDPKILFCGSSNVFTINMRDTEPEWRSISPDLTRGELLLGNRYPAITAIAQSPVDSLRMYAGTQDGKVWTTPDGGENWIDISEGTPGWLVTSIEPSLVEPDLVYISFTGYRERDNTPYIFKSENAGETYVGLGNDIPMVGVNNLMLLPGWNDAVILAATDGGVYVTENNGQKWERVGTNMPHIPVYDVDFNPVKNEIIAATFCRGIMTFPVEELDLLNAVDDISNNSTINLYPTIVKDHFTLDLSLLPAFSEKISILLADINGKIILKKQIQADRSCVNVELVGRHQPGTYIVSVSQGTINYPAQKIILQ